MRTTITLDDDVLARINKEMRRSGKSFKQTVNEFLRIGLSMRREFATAGPFKVRAYPMGLRPGLSGDRISDLLEEAEGPQYW
jgi:hypothetical protein